MLARSLKESKELSTWEWINPVETVRATVLGAGTQTTEISGATIHADSSDLPIRNLPVYEFDFDNNLFEGLKRLPTAFQNAVDLYDSQREGQNFSLYLTNLPYLGFRDVQQLAGGILDSIKAKPNPKQPLVIVLESDHAKVLGQTLQVQNPTQSIICIDQIRVDQGDYIDIGHLLQTNVVPVVIKTLTFHHQ
jgi:ethanolamine utilization protein EutA